MVVLVLSKANRTRIKGKFVAEDNPPARPIQVCLPEPLITALDEYGRKNGTGRGRSISALLKEVLDVPEAPSALPSPISVARKDFVRLELVDRGNPLYLEWRKNHYILR